jgi:phosphatidylserine decarboxylase
MDSAETPGFGARLFVAIQYALPQHLLSRIVFWATRRQSVSWKNALIRWFLRHFDVDMTEAAEPDPFAYPTFNLFFTRALRPGIRPVTTTTCSIASPVDGSVSAAGAIDDGLLLQAKGHYYSLDALLAGDAALTRQFRGGRFATLYLAPHNYHRVHMPIAGTLTTTAHVPGRLFSVNTTTAARVPGLFARNERVICAFDTEHGPLAMILVGALFVGSMSTVWAGDITPRSGRRPSQIAANARHIHLERGAEMGRFNMGSTVIVLLAGNVKWAETLVAGRPVRVGESIGVASAANEVHP